MESHHLSGKVGDGESEESWVPCAVPVGLRRNPTVGATLGLTDALAASDRVGAAEAEGLVTGDANSAVRSTT